MGEHEESQTKQGTSSNKKRSDKTKKKENKGKGKECASPRSAGTANQTAQARGDESVNNVSVHRGFVHICQPPTYISRLRIHRFMKYSALMS